MALLEVRGLVKIYGRRRVVDGVDFDVNAGEVVGLLGPNGAGKTTSFRMTTGQLTPYSGEVWFNGENVTQLPMFRRARLGMGYLPQETSVFRKLTVEQNILAVLEMMPMMRTLGRRLNRRERRQRTDEVLEHFGLTKIRKSTAAMISGGEKRRLEIARCLVSEPLLILLDEPFTGIDPITIGDIREIVKNLRDQGIGLLLTDHNVREALKITTRSYLIKDGKVRTHGTPDEIVRDPIAISEYLGKGFHEEGFSRIGENAPAIKTAITTIPEPNMIDTPPPMAAQQMAAMLEAERIQRWIEGLKTPDHELAAKELALRGERAVPHLLDALERRDVELRRQALRVLETTVKKSVVFDPYAPEILRRQQIAALRLQFERKAG